MLLETAMRIAIALSVRNCQYQMDPDGHDPKIGPMSWLVGKYPWCKVKRKPRTHEATQNAKRWIRVRPAFFLFDSSPCWNLPKSSMHSMVLNIGILYRYTEYTSQWYRSELGDPALCRRRLVWYFSSFSTGNSSWGGNLHEIGWTRPREDWCCLWTPHYYLFVSHIIHAISYPSISCHAYYPYIYIYA